MSLYDPREAKRRQLFEAISKAADGHQRDDVLHVLANVLCNVMAQRHPTKLIAAQTELAEMHDGLQKMLAQRYNPDGTRRQTRLLMSDFKFLLRELMAQESIN